MHRSFHLYNNLFTTKFHNLTVVFGTIVKTRFFPVIVPRSSLSGCDTEEAWERG